MRPRSRRSVLAVVLVGLAAGVSGILVLTTGHPADAPPVHVLGAPLPDDTSTTLLDSTSTTTSTSTASSTSTSTTTSRSTSTTATSAPARSSPPRATPTLHVEGTFSGTERFALNTGRCSLLDHHLDSVFILADETVWKFHSDYCGTIEGDLWRGQGTFSFTLDDGATLTGRFSDSARLPSAGEPYTLHVTGGTQRYVATTGSCLLDNHLRPIRFGVQEQYGSFRCDLRS